MNQPAPRVSIILPTFNRAHIIGRTIENILEQTFKDLELIIVDDGSSDNTKEMVLQFRDPRIRFVERVKNGGEAAARNTGLAAARGRYIANQDSDDIWLPTKLAEEIQILEATSKNVGAVYSRIERTFLDGSTSRIPSDTQRQVSGNLLKTFLRGDFYITSQAIVIKKECFDRIGGFDENLRLLNDAEICIRLAEHYDFAYNPHVRVLVTITEASQSRNFKKRLEAREYILKKHGDLLKRHPPTYAAFAYRIGNTHAIRGDMNRARQFLWMAFRAVPKNVRYAGAFFCALLGSRRLYRALGALHGKIR